MEKVDSFVARDTMRAVGMPEGMAMSIDLMCGHFMSMPRFVVDYACALYSGGMADEQIITVIQNSLGACDIFNVRRFFRELRPLAKRFGFTREQISADIAMFDSEMKQYGNSVLTLGAAQRQIEQTLITTDMTKILEACQTKNGKYYRAAVDTAIWAVQSEMSEAQIIKVLNRCFADGANMRRLMRMTTAHRYKVVSRKDGETIIPVIKMRNMKYVAEVHKFFTEHSETICSIATKYKDVDFWNAFYKLCVGWKGWTWKPADIVPYPFDVRTPFRDLVGLVLHTAAKDLSEEVRKMIANVAESEFAHLVPNTYEFMFDKIVRVFDPAQKISK